MLPFSAAVGLAFGALPAVAIRAASRADADSRKPHDEDCWNPFAAAPDNLGTLTAIMTRNLGQPCRHEVQGLLEDLLKECEKIEGFSEWECLRDLMLWFTGHKELNEGLRAKLADAPKEAMLWAGFHDGDPRGLNHKALADFANLVDSSIVHPSTILGKVVQKNNDLLGCRGDPGASVPCFKQWSGDDDKGPLVNFWNGASRAFVESMAARNQSSVVAVLNKGLNATEKWSLYKSVFWNYELMTLADALHEDGSFTPQILLVDMRGTCQKLVKLVKQHLRGRIGRFADTFLDAKPIMCYDCPRGQCDLDEALAARVRSCLGKDGWLSSVRNWFRPPKCPRFQFEFWRDTEVAVPVS